MNIRFKKISILFLALAASLFLLDAYAGKPAKVEVTSAFPDFALQGDTTEVEIDGTGFDAGSTARFIVTDTRDDTQIESHFMPGNSKSGGSKRAHAAQVGQFVTISIKQAETVANINPPIV